MWFSKKLVFSGGTSNVITESGESARNANRDWLNEGLKAAGYEVFDPQIWGRSYDSNVDGPNERRAREKAYVMIYELGDATDGHITMDEIIKDANKGRRVIVWLSGTPNEKGQPVFRPAGYKPETIADPVTRKHADNAINRASARRRDLVGSIADEHKLGRLPHTKVVRTKEEVVAALGAFGIRI